VVHAHRTDARTELPPRVGFVVSKSVGGAVVRNRVKRRLRALMAARLVRVPQGYDVVVRANPAAANVSYAELGADLDRLLAQVVRP
jgi:ribonuclease P protein component